MADKFPIATLVELAKISKDDCTKRLGQLQRAKLKAIDTLKLLTQYRQDYIDQLNCKLSEGISGPLLDNFNGFVVSIDVAIARQQKILDEADAQLALSKVSWHTANRRHNSFGTLADREQKTAEALEKRKDLRSSDEQTARLLLNRKRES